MATDTDTASEVGTDEEHFVFVKSVSTVHLGERFRINLKTGTFERVSSWTSDIRGSVDPHWRVDLPWRDTEVVAESNKAELLNLIAELESELVDRTDYTIHTPEDKNDVDVVLSDQ